MAMTGTGMRDAVFNALKDAGKFGTMTDPQLADVKASMLLTYEAVVSYIQSNAVVSTNVTTAVSTVVGFPIPVQVVPATGTGATTAPGAGAGTGTGTGTGTIA